MKRRYSKPCGDVRGETRRLLERNAEMLARQQALVRHLAQAAPRQACLLCAAPLAGVEAFAHRGLDFLLCPACGHIQTAAAPPEGYPQGFDPEASFGRVYPPFNAEEFASRKERVYRPKAQWALEVLRGLDPDGGSSWNAGWLDIGCGQGHFLSTLRDLGVQRVEGLEGCEDLVRQAGAVLGPGVVRLNSGSLAEAAGAAQARVFSAFFVLEHCEDPAPFFEALAGKPRGTALYLAVPIFGLSALLEDCSPRHFARNLDGVLHTQIYTERSLAYALELAGFQPVAEWVFGQDALDFQRMAALACSAYPAELREGVEAAVAAMTDGLQGLVDRNHFCDARHVVAVKS
jgi:2-polyprenyl-3-methyl-5-hydroxy-6-metoxy-1,4-benzoquinol methylase